MAIFALSVSVAVAPRSPATECRLRIHLLRTTGLSASQVDTARAQVERIWRCYGVAFEWAAGPPAAGPLEPGTLLVTLDAASRRGSGASGGARSAAVGETVFLGAVQPDRLIRVTADPGPLFAEAYLDDRPVSSWTRRVQDRFLAQAVGRTLAHEIGHYLLASRQHASRGLLRSRFTTSQLLSGDLEPFRLDSGHEALLSGAWLAGAACLAPESPRTPGATVRP